MGLVDGVIAVASTATAVAAATRPSGKGSGDGEDGAEESKEEGAGFGEGLPAEVSAAIASHEASGSFKALERLLTLVGDTPARRSAVTRLCDAMGELASETGRKGAAGGDSKASSGAALGSAGGASGGKDLAAPLAAFNVVLRALPSVTAALPALHRLCVLARDLSLKSGRDSDAVSANTRAQTSQPKNA